MSDEFQLEQRKIAIESDLTNKLLKQRNQILDVSHDMLNDLTI